MPGKKSPERRRRQRQRAAEQRRHATPEQDARLAEIDVLVQHDTVSRERQRERALAGRSVIMCTGCGTVPVLAPRPRVHVVCDGCVPASRGGRS